MPTTIAAYNNAQTANEKKTCAALAKHIDRGLPKAEKKIWHGHPVWFDGGNPLVGYAVRKAGVQLLFWSGRSSTNCRRVGGSGCTAHASSPSPTATWPASATR